MNTIMGMIPVTKFSKVFVTRRARTASDQSKFFERVWENFCSQKFSQPPSLLYPLIFAQRVLPLKIWPHTSRWKTCLYWKWQYGTGSHERHNGDDSRYQILSLAVLARRVTSQSFLKGFGKTFVHKSFPSPPPCFIPLFLRNASYP